MKTTVDIPDNDLKKVMRNTGADTKRDAILTAIRKFNRRIELEEINRSLKGQYPDFMSREELMKLRKMK